MLVSHPTGPLPWQELIIKGNYLYLAAAYYNFYVFDSNPLNPQQIGWVDLNYWPLEIDISGNYAYVANSDSGLRIIDISVPSIPTIVGTYQDGGACTQVCMYQNYAFTDMIGYPIIDCTNPSSPQVVGNLNITNPIKDMFIEGNKLYVGESGFGIKIFDLMNPSNPNFLGADSFTGVENFFVVNDTIYGGYGFWLRVVDARIPSSASELGLFNIGHNIMNVHISNGRAFVLNDDRAVRAIDIKNLQSMSEIGYYQYTSQHVAHDIFSVGDYVYIAHGDVGGIIIQYEQNTSIEESNNFAKKIYLTQNYPNPFNSSTIITYSLDKRQTVKLYVYNTRGEIVKTLVNQEKGPGTYNVKFEGKDISSGIYFYTMKISNKGFTKKLLLLK